MRTDKEINSEAQKFIAFKALVSLLSLVMLETAASASSGTRHTRFFSISSWLNVVIALAFLAVLVSAGLFIYDALK